MDHALIEKSTACAIGKRGCAWWVLQMLPQRLSVCSAVRKCCNPHTTSKFYPRVPIHNGIQMRASPCFGGCFKCHQRGYLLGGVHATNEAICSVVCTPLAQPARIHTPC